jgi:hypothetical protein
MDPRRVLHDLDQYPLRSFSPEQLQALHTVNRGSWEAPRRLRDFEAELASAGVRSVRLAANDYHPFTRYVLPATSAYEVALSLRPRSFFSHGTAAFLHRLIGKPANIYVNKEQSPKSPRKDQALSQEAVDRAFQGPQRVSHWIVKFRGQPIVLLSGQHTDEYAVSDLEAFGRKFRVTSLERTLVEMTVRPSYADGPSTVLHAFRAARSRLSVRRLLAVLERFDYFYPFHQVIGFYLQHAGFPDKDHRQFRRELSVTFYLAHGMKNPQYDRHWRLHYPKGLNRFPA